MIEMVAYRGSKAPPEVGWIRQCELPVYFGDKDVANAYAQSKDDELSPRIYPCVIKIHRPFINQPLDCFIELAEICERFGIIKALQLALKFAEDIQQTDNWTSRINPDAKYHSIRRYLAEDPRRVNNLYFLAYKLLADPYEVAWMRSLGFDGAIHQGSGFGSASKPEYCVFYPQQIKSIFEVRSNIE